MIARSYDGDELLPLLRGNGPTVLSMLPSALFALTRDHGAQRGDFASLRLCRAAGDCVSAELEREFGDLAGMVIDEAYGLTETGLVSVSPPSGDIRVGSVGPPAPGVEVEIRGEDGEVLEAGAEGRVWLRTPSATVGYWENEAATAEAFRDGWLDTGDVMSADADGYLRFCGRRKQIIVHDGSNITPQVVEGALVEHPSVESAGVVGIHDLVHGENVRAYVTLRDGAERPAAQTLIRFARERVGYKAPEEIVFLDEMPRHRERQGRPDAAQADGGRRPVRDRRLTAQAGCHSSIRLPSGSVTQPNRPTPSISCVSGATLAPLARSCASIASRSRTLKLSMVCWVGEPK